MARESNFIDYVCQQIRLFDLARTNLRVVLPSLRLKRVLTRRLIQLAEADGRLPCWLPQFSTIDQLLSELSGLRKADPVELQAWLYRTYRDIYIREGEQPRTFELFWEWGRMLISDFNQIDNQLAPAEEIFHYIAEEKRIGAWHLDLSRAEGELQSKYLAFYRKLGPIYREFTTRLTGEGCGYAGLAGRTACKKLPELIEKEKLPPHSFYLFAGLNALTAAEQQIIKTLIRNKKAEIIWNADRYYTDAGSGQEAGHFLRKYMQDPDLNHHLTEDDIADRIRNTEIEIIECSQRTGQAKLTARILEQKNDAKDTVVVLNDESLLAPVMNSIPERFSCNVTLASPLSGTWSGSLYTTLLRARESSFRNRSRNIPAPLLLSLLRNPLFNRLARPDIATGMSKKNGRRFPDTPTENINFQTLSAEEAIDRIIRGHRLYFSEPEFRSFFPEDAPQADRIVRFIFPENTTEKGKKMPEPAEALADMQYMARFLLDSEQIAQNGKPIQTGLFDPPETDSGPVLSLFEKNYLLNIEQICRQQNHILKRFPDIDLGLPALQKLLAEIPAGIGLNYTGQQENDLNVMGMLETRGMHFKHAILLSMNEGILPAVPAQESFLLYSVREHYGIPTETEQTAMQAHHFYSLLQNCEKVTLVYVNAPTDKNAEKSRFLLQLEHELPRQISVISNSYPFTLRHPQYEPKDLCVTKSPSVLNAMKGRLASGISYSSLSTWLQCPMQFYFRYIMGLGEPPEINDELDASLKGSVFHHAMDLFFSGRGPDGKDRRKLILKQEDADSLRKQIDPLILSGMQAVFPGGDFDHGKNYLSCQEIRIWMERYAAAMEKEISQGELIVLDCEKKFMLDLPDLIPGIPVRINGYADRIDSYRLFGENNAGKMEVASGASPAANAVLRIIDYKTGRIRNLAPDHWEQLKEKDGAQALQLLLYLFLYRNLYPNDRRHLQACICSLKNRGEIFALGGEMLENLSDRDRTGQIREFIRNTVNDMLDPNMEIRCTDKPDHCEYCAYAEFCKNNKTAADAETEPISYFPF